MEKIKYLVLILLLTVFIPATSFAFFDIGAYGGYSFEGNLQKPKISGSEFGLIAHVSFTIAKYVTLGLGGYYNRQLNSVVIPYSLGSIENKYSKDSVGLDGFLQINIPKFTLHPYARVSTSIWEKAEGFRFKSINDVTIEEIFKTYAFGGGISFPIIQTKILDRFHIYIEYLYTISQLKGNDLSTHTIHAGGRIFI